MAENRIPREVDNRQLAERPKAWTPPELLPCLLYTSDAADE